MYELSASLIHMLSRHNKRLLVCHRPVFWFQDLTTYLEKLKPHFDKILALEPTGWTHSDKITDLGKIRPKRKSEKIIIYGKNIGFLYH